MRTVAIIVPASQEQKDIVLDHLLYKTELGILPDERAWLRTQAQKQFPGCKVIAADLDIEEAEWHLTLEVLK